jgi:hypothetical protein
MPANAYKTDILRCKQGLTKRMESLLKAVMCNIKPNLTCQISSSRHARFHQFDRQRTGGSGIFMMELGSKMNGLKEKSRWYRAISIIMKEAQALPSVGNYPIYF